MGQCPVWSSCDLLHAHLQQGLLLLAPSFASERGVMQQGHPARTCKMERRLEVVSVKRQWQPGEDVVKGSCEAPWASQRTERSRGSTPPV